MLRRNLCNCRYPRRTQLLGFAAVVEEWISSRGMSGSADSAMSHAGSLECHLFVLAGGAFASIWGSHGYAVFSLYGMAFIRHHQLHVLDVTCRCSDTDGQMHILRNKIQASGT